MSYKETKYLGGSFDREWRNASGEYHRELAPAAICYYPDSSIKAEYFYINGKPHRELGPAVIYYNGDGSIEIEEFWLQGECIGIEKKGFWALWDNLTEEQRKNPELLKYLARFS
jgi:antitoxin component YwqK of YwqJK toxin-antitoxin module